jgi:hypothetical protein
MRQLLAAFIIIHLIILPLSPQGIEAFSAMTGLDISIGTIELDNDYKCIVKGIGKKDGVVWKVISLWEGGLPHLIWLYDPKYEM